MLKQLALIALCLSATSDVSAKDYNVYDTSDFRNNKPNCAHIYSGPQEAMCKSHLYDLSKEEEFLFKDFLKWAKSPVDKSRNSITESIEFKISFPKILEDSETAWATHRDTTCRLEGQEFSGTQQSSVIIECLAENIQNRIDYLKEFSSRIRE